MSSAHLKGRESSRRWEKHLLIQGTDFYMSACLPATVSCSWTHDLFHPKGIIRSFFEIVFCFTFYFLIIFLIFFWCVYVFLLWRGSERMSDFSNFLKLIAELAKSIHRISTDLPLFVVSCSSLYDCRHRERPQTLGILVTI